MNGYSRVCHIPVFKDNLRRAVHNDVVDLRTIQFDQYRQHHPCNHHDLLYILSFGSFGGERRDMNI